MHRSIGYVYQCRVNKIWIVQCVMLIICHPHRKLLCYGQQEDLCFMLSPWSAERRHINENYVHNKGKIKLFCVHLNTTPWRRIQRTGSLNLGISGGIQLQIPLYTHRKCQRCLMDSKKPGWAQKLVSKWRRRESALSGKRNAVSQSLDITTITDISSLTMKTIMALDCIFRKRRLPIVFCTHSVYY